MKNSNLRWLYGFYAIMLIIMVSWTSRDSVPLAPLRIGFLTALVAPLFVYKPTWAPIIITLFLVVSRNGFSQSYMPVLGIFYVLILVGLIALHSKRIVHIKEQPVLIVLFFSAVLANLLSGVGGLENDSYYYSLIFVFLFAFLTPSNDTNYPHVFSYAFIFATLSLSVLYLLFRHQFEAQSMIGGEFNRDYWMDPNYWGCVVGMGTTASFVELFSDNKKTTIKGWFLVGVILVSLIALLLNASRGAILSISLSFSVLILFSRQKKGLKFFVLCVVAIGLYLMYNSGVMDFFIYRVTSDEGQGSGRVGIWTEKLAAFSGVNPLYWITGMGKTAGYALASSLLGSSSRLGFHSDYVAYLVEYGIVGFMAFLYFLFGPLKEKKNRIVVLPAVVYMASCCFTLEPLTNGNFAYFAFVFYIYVWSRSNETAHIS